MKYFTSFSPSQLLRFPLLYFIMFSITASSQPPVDGFYVGKGNLQLVLGAGAEFDENFYAGTEIISFGRNIYNVNAQVGIGVLENFDIYLSGAYLLINEEQSVQDGKITAKYALLSRNLSGGRLTFSLAAGYSDNLASYQTEGGSALGQEAKIFDIRPVLHYSTNEGWFATAQAAYNFKEDPVPDAFTSGIKIGRAASKLYWDLWYYFQNSYGGLDYRGIPAPLSFRELGVGFHDIGATVSKSLFGNLSVYTGVSYTLSGRNIGRGVGISAGLVLRSGN